MNSVKTQPTVLVVDDDQGLTKLIGKALKREGFSTSTADSGKTALDWLKGHTADLMLLDLKLQDCEGPELVEQLAEQGYTIPFVVITGQGDERVAVEMMKRGAMDYLVKDGQFLELVPSVTHRAIAQLDKDRRLAAAEKELKEEHAFSTAVLRTSGAIMIVVENSGRIAQVNQACERATGFTNEEVEGKTFWESFLPPDHWEASRQRLAATFEAASSVAYEGLMLTKSGEFRQISWTITSLKNDDGSPNFVIASGLDVTDRRRLEREVLEISGREQQRIGQDLHDGLCQVLAGIEVLTEVLRKRMANSSVGDASALSSISGYIHEAIKQSRMLARGLSPVEIDSRGLMSALEELAYNTQELFKVHCKFECPDPVLVDDNTKATHLYRIAQESISNAIKHGRSKHIVVTLFNEGDTTKLKVTDDGIGFSSASADSNGMGLRTMKYRASTIGAELAIASAQPKGTVVQCSFVTGL